MSAVKTTLFVIFFVHSLQWHVGTSAASFVRPKRIKAGFLISFSGVLDGNRFAGAIPRVIDDINKDDNILRGINFTYTFKDSGCNSTFGIGATVDLYMEGVDVFLGPPCSKSCISAGHFSTAKKIPMISYSCSTIELSDKKLYPYFVRTKPFARGSSTWTPKTFIAILKYYKWKYVCLIRRMDQLYNMLGQETEAELMRNNITIGERGTYYEQENTFMKKGEILQNLKNKCRIFILIASRKETAEIMVHAYHQRLTQTPRYAFLGIDYRRYTKFPSPSWNIALGTNYSYELYDKEMVEGLISVQAQYPDEKTPTYLDFEEDVMKRIYENPFNRDNSQGSNKTNNIAMYLYDGTMHYARAIDRMLADEKDIHDAEEVIRYLMNTTFQGYTGHVQLDKNGDRIPAFNLFNVHNGELVRMGYFDTLLNDTIKINGRILFPGHTEEVPVDMPKCGFDNELCLKEEEEFNYILLAIMAPFIVALVVVALVYTYNKKKYELRMISKGLILDIKDMSFGGGDDCSFRSKISAMSFGTHLSRKLSTQFIGVPLFPSSTAQVVMYKKKKVFVKTYKNVKIELSWETLLELKHIKDINHTNVNLLIGVAPQGTHMHVAWSFCSKGSLQDVLQNEDLNCDWMFRLSFANDIVKGLMEIHRSNVGVHGNLNSSNCLVDNRWVCKLSDFGMQQFKSKIEGNNNNLPPRKKDLWKAPELLLDSKINPTRETDVYSYALLLYEIQTREDLYNQELSHDEMKVEDIVTAIKKGGAHPMRPLAKQDSEGPIGYMELMKKCWAHHATERPPLKEIGKVINRMQRENSESSGGSLVDHMLTMMEKYTDNLEDLVAERTRLLEEEKIKTETLLYKMLPKSVANRLKEGQPVLAENFSSVTIFFSDIVGFTKLCSESSPLEVVEMLNDLYSCFDNCIDQYDVYKVETIGDAYMVVSGLPIRNEDKHAGEIASMSLDLLSCVRSFKIKHKPSMQMQLRIGMHTGSCVAGVVGVKMPRYCLFGDTVNYASRMESSGLALRIHVSPDSKTVLDKLPGYHLAERGPVEMKGKGTITTFFLIGKDGFVKPLPDLTLAASLESHSFK